MTTARPAARELDLQQVVALLMTDENGKMELNQQELSVTYIVCTQKPEAMLATEAAEAMAEQQAARIRA